MTHYRRHIAFQPRPMAHKPPGCPDISFPLRCRATLDGLGLPSPSAFPQLAPMLAQLFECGRIDASSVTESGDPNTVRGAVRPSANGDGRWKLINRKAAHVCAMLLEPRSSLFSSFAAGINPNGLAFVHLI